MSNYDFEYDDLIDFRDSALDSIFKVRKLLQKIKDNFELSDGFKYIYNEVFGINGTAAVMDLKSMTELLTEMEDCSRPFYLRKVTITPEIIDAFQDACDRLEDILDELDEDFEEIEEVIEAMNLVEVSDVVLYLRTNTQMDQSKAEANARLFSKLNQNQIDNMIDDLIP